MRFVVGSFETLGGDMRVHLGSGQMGMPQQFLNAPEIGPCVQQVGGVTMSQFVRRQTWIQSGNLKIPL